MFSGGLKRLFRSLLDYIALTVCVYFSILLLAAPDTVFNISYYVAACSISNAELLPIGTTFWNVFGVLLTSLGLIVLFTTIKQFFFNRQYFDLKHVRGTILVGLIVSIFVLGFFQIIACNVIFWKSFIKADSYGDVHNIVKNIRYIEKRHPYCRNWQFETDLDTSVDPGMFVHRLWRYFLFPKGFSRLADDSDCILFVQKENYEENVPKGFEIIDHLSKKDAVAVRKDWIR